MQLSLLDSAGRAPAPKPGPIVKWAGGKTRLLPQLLPLLPRDAARRRHVEPFAGGAAMFFHRQPKRALLCDANTGLCAMYRAVRDNVSAVIVVLRDFATNHNENAYYAARDAYNRQSDCDIETAALFIYLNHTGFNGLYRENKRGQFNVPMGRYTNPRILDEQGLRSASATLQGVDIRHQKFELLLEQARPNDFVYLDPPYEPVSETANFTAYGADGFTRDDQARLRHMFVELDRLGCKLMLSNSDVPFIRELYDGYRVDGVIAQRSVSCNGAKRGAVQELVVRNYE